ncbi:hypothetical protein ACLKA7_001266 [Drosophila subpalustris]
MAADSRECTAFTVPGRGLYQWRVMPFGLHSACATFQRALDTVIGPEMEPHDLDDIVVIGATKEQHVANLKEVFRRLRAANLKLNRKKCSFFRKRLVYLGHVISAEGICTDPGKVEAIRNLKAPASCKELRQCLGMASWYRRFVPNFATLVQPMTELLKKGRKWSWDEKQEEALCQLKEKLTTAPVLACPDFSAKFVLQTDASDYGLGDDQERVIAYASRKLLKAEMNYSVTEKECLAIVWSIRKLQCYLEGYHFDVECHDAPTAGLQGVKKTVSRLSQRYYWPGMFRDAAWYVKCCEVCQKFECEQRKPAGQMLTRQVAEPTAVLCADFVGPLPRSKRGHTMFLVFHDAFSPKFDGPYRVVKFVSPNIVRLAREGERRRRVANVMQLKPFFKDGNGEAEEAPLEDPGEATPGGNEPRQSPRRGQRQRDPRRGRLNYGGRRQEERPRRYKHTVYHGTHRSVDRYDGPVVCMAVEYSTMFIEVPQARNLPSYVEEPPSPPRFPALSESGGAPKSEASREERLVPSPMEVERVEHQVPSLPMEPGVADEWIVEDEEMVNEETADEERVEHQVPSPAMEKVAADEWLVEDEMADGQRVEHPVPSPAMKDDEWSVEAEEPADGQPVDHPVRQPVRKTVAADGEIMKDADRKRLPSDVPIFSALAPTAGVDRPDSPQASENSGEAEPAAEAGAKEKGGARKFWEQFGSRELGRAIREGCETHPNLRLDHSWGCEDVATQSVSAARVVIHEEDRSVTMLMPPEDGPLSAGSNMPTRVVPMVQ